MFSKYFFATLFVFFAGTNGWSAEIDNGPPQQPRGGFENEKQYILYLNKSVTWYKDYSNTLRTLSANLSKKVSERNLYMVMVPNKDSLSRYMATDKNTALDITLTSYLAELRQFDKPFRKEELKYRIKRMRQHSLEVKNGIMIYIDELDQMASQSDSLRVSFENTLRSSRKSNTKPNTRNNTKPSTNRLITVLSASYGLNCHGVLRKNSTTKYSVNKGNATAHIKGQCNRLPACDYWIGLIGAAGNGGAKKDKKPGLAKDPAKGCIKDYRVTYKCNENGLPKTETRGPKKDPGWGTMLRLSCE